MFKGLDKPKDEAVEATPFEGMVTIDKPEIDGSSTRTRLAVLPAAEVTFNKEDLVTPRLKLMQGLSTEVQDGNARPGQWVLTGYTPGESVDLVPLAVARQRARYIGEGDNREQACFSRDAITGVGDPGGSCEGCPMSKWTGSEDSRKKPQCDFSYAYLVYSLTHKSVAALQFRGTGLNAGKMLNTMVAQRGLRNFGCSLKAVSKKGPKGTYYQPSVNPTTVDPTALDEARLAAQAWG